MKYYGSSAYYAITELRELVKAMQNDINKLKEDIEDIKSIIFDDGSDV